LRDGLLLGLSQFGVGKLQQPLVLCGIQGFGAVQEEFPVIKSASIWVAIGVRSRLSIMCSVCPDKKAKMVEEAVLLKSTRTLFRSRRGRTVSINSCWPGDSSASWARY